jgi:DNA-binding NarL/FixJ family response regulator
MSEIRLVILSGQSLFAEATANRLRQLGDDIHILVLDPGVPDSLKQVQRSKPSLIIMDMSDPDLAMLCPLGELLVAVPGAKVVLLDPQQSYIHVITTEHRQAVEARDLIDLINTP